MDLLEVKPQKFWKRLLFKLWFGSEKENSGSTWFYTWSARGDPGVSSAGTACGRRSSSAVGKFDLTCV